MIDWNSVLQTLGSSAILVGMFAWLAKSIISAYISRNVEKHKSDLSAQAAIETERLRSSLEVEASKRTLEFTALHTKRAEFIADLYGRLLDIQGLLSRLHFEYRHREIREDLDRRFYRDKREDWQLEPGIDTLRPEEQARIDELNDSLTEFYEFFKKHRLYFSSEVCDLIDRFATLASYQAMNYQNIALKDEEGNLLVHPSVKETWDLAIEKAPELLSLVESEFRSILGVESTSAAADMRDQAEAR